MFFMMSLRFGLLLGKQKKSEISRLRIFNYLQIITEKNPIFQLKKIKKGKE